MRVVASQNDARVRAHPRSRCAFVDATGARRARGGEGRAWRCSRARTAGGMGAGRGGAGRQRVYVDDAIGAQLSVGVVDDASASSSSSPPSSRGYAREYEIVMRYSASRVFRWRALALGVTFAWRAAVGTSSVASVAFVAFVCAWTLGTRAQEARLVRHIGLCVDTVSWFGGRRSVLIPAEDIEAFATREAVSTTDVWFQILCLRARGEAPMVLFGDFRYSAVWTAAVLDAAQKCFNCVE